MLGNHLLCAESVSQIHTLINILSLKVLEHCVFDGVLTGEMSVLWGRG